MGSLLGRGAGGGSHGVPAGGWAGGGSHGVLAGGVGVHMGSLLGGWGFTWGPGGAVWGFFHMGWLGFHLNFCRAVGGFLKAVTLEPPGFT